MKTVFWEDLHVILEALGTSFFKSNQVGHHIRPYVQGGCPDFQGFCKYF